jgi:hypothetical protein
MSPQSRAERNNAEPTPYELYIRLPQLAALWPAGSQRGAANLIATCGLQAAELTLRLIEDAAGDERLAAVPSSRVTRYAEHLVDGVDFTCRLLGRFPTPPLSVPSNGAPSAPSPGFAALAMLGREQLDAVTGRLTLATSALPFELGIEGQLAATRSAQGLFSLRRERSGDVSIMDYQAVVSPATVHALHEQSPCGREDHLFSTVHQITECWLNIAHHHLAAACRLAEDKQWVEAADALADACSAVGLAIQAGQLLDQMVLADYHPLRVRLRDGSGAQSPAARRLGPAVRDAAECLWAALARDQRTVGDLLERPAEHLEQYRYLTGVKAAGKQCQSFLFSHYLLVLGVLGTHSFGSLGYEVRELARRAVEPMFPQINEAHHDLVMLTNFQHGGSSGAIVYKNECSSNSDPYAMGELSCACPREAIETQTQAYFRAIEQRDAQGWVDLFDPVRGQLHDVEGTRPYLGTERLRVFIRSMFRSFSEMRATCSPPRINGNTASVDWHFDAISYHGIPTQLSGREDFIFDKSGRILRAVAHWRPAEVAQQWQEELQQRAADGSTRRYSEVRSLLGKRGEASANGQG